MFRSQVTQQLSEPGEKQFRTVTERRERIYLTQYKDDEGKIQTRQSKGWEIVKETIHREGEL